MYNPDLNQNYHYIPTYWLAKDITTSFYGSGEKVRGRMLLEVQEEEEGGEEDGLSNEEEGGKDDDLSEDGDVKRSKEDELALSMDESSEDDVDMEDKEYEEGTDEDDSSGEEYDAKDIKVSASAGERRSTRVAALEKKKKKKKEEEKEEDEEEEAAEEEAEEEEEEVDKQRFYVLEKEMVETIVVHAIMQQILGVTRKYNSTKEEEKGNDSIKEMASFFEHLNNIAVEESEEGKEFVETCNDIANDGDVEGDSLKEKLTTLIKSHHNRRRK